MKITRRILRRLIRESFEEQHQAVHAFNRSLTEMFNEIQDGVLNFDVRYVGTHNPEVDKALKGVKDAMFQLKKALYDNIGRGQQLKEHVTDEHHEHPHGHARISVPHVNNKDEAEDLLHDTFLAVEEHLSLDDIEAIIAQLY